MNNTTSNSSYDSGFEPLSQLKPAIKPSAHSVPPQLHTSNGNFTAAFPHNENNNNNSSTSIPLIPPLLLTPTDANTEEFLSEFKESVKNKDALILRLRQFIQVMHREYNDRQYQQLEEVKYLREKLGKVTRKYKQMKQEYKQQIKSRIHLTKRLEKTENEIQSQSSKTNVQLEKVCPACCCAWFNNFFLLLNLNSKPPYCLSPSQKCQVFRWKWWVSEANRATNTSQRRPTASKWTL